MGMIGLAIRKRIISLAAFDVLNERDRQIDKEGYNTDHDDGHNKGDLSGAGAAYALNASRQLDPHYFSPLKQIPSSFMWEESSWKPKTAREDLVRAAALIIAEIERIDRRN